MSNDTSIFITHCPLSTIKEEVFAMSKEDAVLIDAILSHSQKLSQRGVETFTRVGNIIATEEGYYCAFYASDLTAKAPLCIRLDC